MYGDNPRTFSLNTRFVFIIKTNSIKLREKQQPLQHII